MPDARTWVTDTSVYTHLCRAGHVEILERLAPGGVVLVPDDVRVEIENGRDRHPNIPDPSSTPWTQVIPLTDDEVWTQILVKAALAGGPTEHLGECAVIAVASTGGTPRSWTSARPSHRQTRTKSSGTTPCGWSSRLI